MHALKTKHNFCRQEIAAKQDLKKCDTFRKYIFLQNRLYMFVAKHEITANDEGNCSYKNSLRAEDDIMLHL